MKRQEDLKKCHSEPKAKNLSIKGDEIPRSFRPRNDSLHTAYIGIGSNLEDRLKNCENAVSKLDAHAEICVTKISSWIETDPIGYTDQPKFMNGTIEIKTSLSPVELLSVLQQTEKKLGRKPNFRWGPRAIDLDLLLYDSLSIDSPPLTLPHPRMKEREFVKIPLLEINPALKHFF